MDYQKHLGRWINTYAHTKGICAFELFVSKGQLMLQVTGAEHGFFPEPFDAVPLRAYGKSPTDPSTYAYTVDVQTPQSHIRMALNMNKGLMILAAYCSPGTEGQHDFFLREFYAHYPTP